MNVNFIKVKENTFLNKQTRFVNSKETEDLFQSENMKQSNFDEISDFRSLKPIQLSIQPKEGFISRLLNFIFGDLFRDSSDESDFSTISKEIKSNDIQNKKENALVDIEKNTSPVLESDTESTRVRKAAEPSIGIGRYDVVEPKVSEEAKQLITDIKDSDEYADIRLNKLMNTFNMSEDELGQHLIDICESDQYGNGCIEPKLLYALMAQESNCDANAKGDYNSYTGEYRAVGLGQMHKITVDEINNQIANGLYGDYTYNNGQKYSYTDRENPQKSLEMTVLYLRYCAENTYSVDEMLAMYNRGVPDGINTLAGKEYVREIYNEIEG